MSEGRRRERNYERIGDDTLPSQLQTSSVIHTCVRAIRSCAREAADQKNYLALCDGVRRAWQVGGKG
jgi:hypothetical protein